MSETASPIASVASPCVGVCLLDPVTGLCRGCFRTGSEIAEWRDAGGKRRLDILRSVAVRRTRSQQRVAVTVDLPDGGRIDDDG